MKALLLFSFIAFANPLDYNQSQCKKARDQLFIVINEGQRFLQDCQLKLVKKCEKPECFEEATFKCIEIFWILRVKAIKKFNKYKCYKSESI